MDDNARRDSRRVHEDDLVAYKKERRAQRWKRAKRLKHLGIILVVLVGLWMSLSTWVSSGFALVAFFVMFYGGLAGVSGWSFFAERRRRARQQAIVEEPPDEVHIE